MNTFRRRRRRRRAVVLLLLIGLAGFVVSRAIGDDAAPVAPPLLDRSGAGPGLIVFTPSAGAFTVAVTWGDPGGLRMGRGIGCSFSASLAKHGEAPFATLTGTEPTGATSGRFTAPSPGQVELNIAAACLDDVGAGPLTWTVIITK